jgi:uncharacterized membrane protein YkoI
MVVLRILLVALCMLAGAGMLGSAASDDDDKRCKRDQDCALDALNRGEIRPFAEVLEAVRRQLPGQVVAVELERDDGIWIYKIKVVAEDGRRRKVEVDAKSLVVLKSKVD